ncbi:hypothetical protein [Methanospirillum hungatei]|uniref:hypothetical protein n=1 Tax=Methanospirillum hungatei TaxID=2203 RepID=UPI0026EC828D|nr:hypothetical protein [Methanospirillum hungatei]MCA1915579.1 hypothetical protein [Methanospirillum hungatei]
MSMIHTREPCVRCRTPSIIHQRYSGRYLCAVHLTADVLVRVKRSIRLDGGLGKKPVLAIIWEGQACLSLLSILGQVIGTRPGMELVLLYNGCDCPDVSKIFPHLPSTITIRTEEIQGRSIRDCVRMAGADRLVRCTTLDEEAELVLGALLSGSCTSILHDPDISPVICLRPFREIPLDELRLIAPDMNIPIGNEAYPDTDVHTFLSSLTRNHPSVPFSLIRYQDRLCDLERDHLHRAG